MKQSQTRKIWIVCIILYRYYRMQSSFNVLRELETVYCHWCGKGTRFSVNSLFGFFIMLLSNHKHKHFSFFVCIWRLPEPLINFILFFFLFFADVLSHPTKEPTVRIKCMSGSMLITIHDAPTSPDDDLFSGMIYPKGLSKNSSCLTEYRYVSTLWTDFFFIFLSAFAMHWLLNQIDPKYKKNAEKSLPSSIKSCHFDTFC